VQSPRITPQGTFFLVPPRNPCTPAIEVRSRAKHKATNEGWKAEIGARILAYPYEKMAATTMWSVKAAEQMFVGFA